MENGENVRERVVCNGCRGMLQQQLVRQAVRSFRMYMHLYRECTRMRTREHCSQL